MGTHEEMDRDRPMDLGLPIVRRRTVLRVIAAGFLLGALVLNGSLLLDPPRDIGDRSIPSDWFAVLILPLMLAGFYAYVSAYLTVDESHVQIHNPFRQVDIPLGHVKEVEPGSNLAIRTDYATFYAWGVEGANVQLATGRFGRQADLATRIQEAARLAGSVDAPAAAYRWSRPDTLLLISLAVAVVEAVLTGVGVGLGQ